MRRFSVILALLVLLWSGAAIAGDTPSVNRFEKGYSEFGFQVGYGFGMNLPPGGIDHGDRTDIQFPYFAPNYKKNITGKMGTGALEGSLFWFPELAVAPLQNPKSAYLVGFSPLMVEYKFTNLTRKWSPTAMIGAGVSYGDWNGVAREISTKLEFLLHGGLGIEFMRSDRGSFSLNYRLLHVSNAGIDKPNVGLNANMFILGFSF